MADLLSEEQKEECKEAFELFVTEGKETIVAQELGTVLRALGQTPTEAELQEMVNDVEANYEGKLDFNEFLAIVAKKLRREEDMEEELLNAFKVFDKNGDGYILGKDLRNIMTTIGEKLSEEEVDEMIREAEMGEDGRINYEEFARAVTSE